MTSLFSHKIQASLEYHESIGKSIEIQKTYLHNFDRFCAENHSEQSCLTKEIAWDWVYSPLHRSSSGVHYRIKAIRFLGKYLSARGEVAYVFPDGMTRIKNKFSPHIFTDEELHKIFSVADTFPYSPFSPLRHKIVPVVFRLIYTCGLRPGEGRKLKRENINLDTGEIRIINTKFKKERLVVMSESMLELCRKYDNYCKSDALIESEYFFPTQSGECYSSEQLAKFFRTCWQKANEGLANLPTVRIYDLRHQFASTVLNRWLDEKRDLYAMLPYLRTFMGHAGLSSTEYYVHLLPENLIKSKGINWAGLESIIPEV